MVQPKPMLKIDGNHCDPAPGRKLLLVLHHLIPSAFDVLHITNGATEISPQSGKNAGSQLPDFLPPTVPDPDVFAGKSYHWFRHYLENCAPSCLDVP